MSVFEDLGLLRAFVSIVESGSISAGARRLRTSQPGLSRQLRALEQLCGTALLRRDTHRMSLTETGQRLLTEAKTLIDQAEAAALRVREDHTTLRGQLRVFTTFDLGQFVVTEMISRFLNQHQELSISLALGNRPMHMKQEGCDVGILPGKITDDSVVARPAGAVSLHLYAAPALVKSRPPVKTLADLASWPWISLDGSQFWSAQELTLYRDEQRQSLRINPRLLSEGVTSVREAVRAGLGVALLPDWLIEDDIRAKQLMRVLHKWKAEDVPIHVVYAGQRVLPARISTFINFAVRDLNSRFCGNKKPNAPARSLKMAARAGS